MRSSKTTAGGSAQGNEFAPFVVTSFGKLGKGAKKVVNKLAGKAVMQMPLDWESPGDWARQMKTTIACRVQRGKAQLVVTPTTASRGGFGKEWGGLWVAGDGSARDERQTRRPRRYRDGGDICWD